jgi:sporulation protein YlmC with PRC-barrel domain
MKIRPSLIGSMTVTVLALSATSYLRADNIANFPDPSKHHHYANPDGKETFSDPANVMPGHYNYDLYYAGGGRVWTPEQFASAPPPAFIGTTGATGGTGASLSEQSTTSIPVQSTTIVPDQSSSTAWTNSSSGTALSQTDTNQAPAPVNKASTLLGMTVKNQNQETLGTIKDVVFNLQSGRVAYVVLQKDGQSGPNANIAVPLTAFTPSPDNSTLILNADKSKVQSSQGFSSTDLPSVNSQSYGAEPEVREHIIIVPVPSSHLNPDQDQDQTTPHPKTSPDMD